MPSDSNNQASWPPNTSPARALLEDLNLLETKDDQLRGNSLWSTPWSLQVITAGATSATKWVASIGGAAGLMASIGTAVTALNAGDNVPLQLVAVGALAVILSATILAIALMVRADVGARASVTAAEYQARALLASTYLQASEPIAEIKTVEAMAKDFAAAS